MVWCGPVETGWWDLLQGRHPRIVTVLSWARKVTLSTGRLCPLATAHRALLLLGACHVGGKGSKQDVEDVQAAVGLSHDDDSGASGSDTEAEAGPETRGQMIKRHQKVRVWVYASKLHTGACLLVHFEMPAGYAEAPTYCAGIDGAQEDCSAHGQEEQGGSCSLPVPVSSHVTAVTVSKHVL